MVQPLQEGVDYSRTPNANWPAIARGLKAAGKKFVGRYAVTDKSPAGRGITQAEYEAMIAEGIDVFIYWEAQESWMLGGYDAGVRAAYNAVKNLKMAGMPENMPVYYSHDIEPQPQHYDEVDACLRGAASVVGLDAVGIYGGFNIIEHCIGLSETARWGAQTWAWSGNGPAWERNISRHAHVYQYETRTLYVAGVSVDLCASLKPHYGQASDFTKRIFPEKVSPAPESTVIRHQNIIVTPLQQTRWTVTDGYHPRTYPHHEAPFATKTTYPEGRDLTFLFEGTGDGAGWVLAKSGNWFPKDRLRPRTRG